MSWIGYLSIFNYLTNNKIDNKINNKINNLDRLPDDILNIIMRELSNGDLFNLMVAYKRVADLMSRY